MSNLYINIKDMELDERSEYFEIERDNELERKQILTSLLLRWRDTVGLLQGMNPGKEIIIIKQLIIELPAENEPGNDLPHRIEIQSTYGIVDLGLVAVDGCPATTITPEFPRPEVDMDETGHLWNINYPQSET